MVIMNSPLICLSGAQERSSLNKPGRQKYSLASSRSDPRHTYPPPGFTSNAATQPLAALAWDKVAAGPRQQHHTEPETEVLGQHSSPLFHLSEESFPMLTTCIPSQPMATEHQLDESLLGSSIEVQ